MKSERVKWRLGLAAVFLLAVSLRVWGINFGLPHRYHIDEPYYVLGALKLANGEFHLTVPHNTPNLWQFLLLGEYGVLFAVGWIVRLFSQPGDIAALYLTDPSVFYVLGRLSSALSGVATVGLTYLLGKDTFDRQTGMIAALFLSLTFLHARDSHYAVNDVFIVLLTTFACYASSVYLKEGDRRLLVFGLVACGAAAGMKYRPAAFLVPLLLAVLWRVRQERTPGALPVWATGVLLVGTLGLGVVIGFPGIIINTRIFLSHFRYALAQAGVGYDGWVVDPAPAWLYYVRMLAIGMGLPMLLASVIGIGLSLKRLRREALVLVFAAGAYYVLIILFKTYFARYTLPLLPLLALLAAYAVRSASMWIGHWRPAWARPAGAILMVACSVVPLTYLVRHDYLLTQTDTRTLAKHWIEANILDGAKIAVDWPVHGPPLSVPGDPEPDSTRVYDVTLVGGKGLSDHSIEWYQEQRFDYLIASSFIYNISLVNAERDAERRAFYASLDQELELVMEFRPYKGDTEPPFVFDEIYGPVISLWQRERPGPVIKIYRVR